MILSSQLLLLLQAAAPTVGDTIWLERRFETPAGAEVRASTWSPEGELGLLGRPVIRREGRFTIIAYPAVAWSAGSHIVSLPGPIIINRDGSTDSLPPEPRTIIVASVLPDSAPVERIPVQPEAGIVAERITTPYPVLLALLIATLLFAPFVWWWRRRGPALPPAEPIIPVAVLPLAEWYEAGERRAVAAVAARELRQAITAHLPGVSHGLVASRLLKVLVELRPAWPTEEVGLVLRGLEAVQYGESSTGDVIRLADRAAALSQRLASGNGRPKGTK